MSIKKLTFAALAILTLALGTVSMGGAAQASNNHYGSRNNVAEGGNG